MRGETFLTWNCGDVLVGREYCLRVPGTLRTNLGMHRHAVQPVTVKGGLHYAAHGAEPATFIRPDRHGTSLQALHHNYYYYLLIAVCPAGPHLLSFTENHRQSSNMAFSEQGPPAAPKPAHILFTCHPLTGHITPALRIASELRRRGWPVSFLGPTTHAARIAANGVRFLPLRGEADLDDLLYYSPDNPNPPVPGYHALKWYQRALVDLEKHSLAPIPAQWACVKDALLTLQEENPEQPVVLISEAFFHGILPLYFGAPLPEGVKKPRTLCLSVTPPAIRSIDLPPFDFPFPFDQSPEGRARNAACWDKLGAMTVSHHQLLQTKLAEAGATATPEDPVLSGVNYTVHEAILQIGVPSFEYPRSDWPAHFQFLGFLPAAEPPAGGYPNIPPWWEEVTQPGITSTSTTTSSSSSSQVDVQGRQQQQQNHKTKQIVVVAQGTVETDPTDLIIPTIEAMRERDNVLVVAIMGRKGATLPRSFSVPVNTRVTDYLHYDAILPYASVWVHNGGYGAVTHGVAHGIPMVVAGEGQDKPENIRRVQYAGIGVGLATPTPGVEDVRAALEDVLGDGTYKARVLALKKETEELDCFGRVERTIAKGST